MNETDASPSRERRWRIDTKAMDTKQRAQQNALAKRQNRRAHPSFGAEEIRSDAHDRHAFARNMIDPTGAVENKRLAYAPGHKEPPHPSSSSTRTASTSGSSRSGERTGRRVYSANRPSRMVRDGDPADRMPGSFPVHGGSRPATSSRAAASNRRNRGRGAYAPGDQSISVTDQTPIAAHIVNDDEEEFEARVQERVSEEIARRIRGDVAQNNNGAAGSANGGPNDNKNDEDDGSTCCGFERWVVVAIIAFAVLLVGGGCGIAASVALTSDDGGPVPGPTPPPLTEAAPGTPGPTIEPTQAQAQSQACTLCADGTAPDGLEENFVVGGDGRNVTCAAYAVTTGAIDVSNDACGANQAFAWLSCGCPTLPPPAEDPVCTLCKNGAPFVGTTAGTCNDLQTLTGLVSTAYPLVSCDSYIDAAAGCECPEGIIVGPSTPAPSPGATQDLGVCTLCADGTIPEGVEDNFILLTNNSTTCAQFAATTATIDPNDEGCSVNQAFAWASCDCPTLPPPAENPKCTICEGGVTPIGYNAVTCQEVQTFVGLISISLPEIPCDVYTEAADYCICP